MSTAGSVLQNLQGVNGAITLALNIGGVLVPLVKGLVLRLRQIATGSDTVSYEILIQTDQTELDQVIQASVADVEAINAELVRMGLPPLALPTGGPDPGKA